MRIPLMAILLTLLFGGQLPAAKKPNILVIMSDDQGWNDIGYHNPEVVTPNLDKLAKQGVRLNRHYVYPTCSPTRAGLLTGRNPSRFDILHPIAGKSKHALPLGTMTLASSLAENGYETAICGKWHLGLRPEVGPKKYGFTYSYGYLHGQIDPLTHRYKLGDKTWHRNDKLIEERGHATDLLSDEAADFIRKKREKPFFLYVPYSVPHTPLIEEEQWLKPYVGTDMEPSRRIYLASITHMDDGIGRIVKALEESGQRENTLILFTSDNGGQKNQGASKTQYEGRFPAYKVLGSNTPLRGYKGSLHEGGVRVPAFVTWPGKLDPGGSDAMLSIMDWLPTFAGVSGADLPEDAKLDGVRALSLIRGKGARAKAIYWRTSKQSAILDGEWKLIRFGGKDGKVELYNVVKDPTEKKNLADTMPEKAKELTEALENELKADKASS